MPPVVDASFYCALYCVGVASSLASASSTPAAGSGVAAAGVLIEGAREADAPDTEAEGAREADAPDAVAEGAAGTSHWQSAALALP